MRRGQETQRLDEELFHHCLTIEAQQRCLTEFMEAAAMAAHDVPPQGDLDLEPRP